MPRKKAAEKAQETAPRRQLWDERMQRWTVIWPKDLIAEVKREARRTGRTHASVVAEAVRRGLAR